MLERETRDFAFPLNVYAELLRLESGVVEFLHYGFFAASDDVVTTAQARAADWLFERLPGPCRVLDVGIGTGTMLERLARAGFDARGITPDAGQIRLARSRDPWLSLTEARLEDFDAAEPFDLLLFQESSQYIDSRSLWGKAARLLGASGRVMVLDEFRCGGDGSLHALDEFLAAAADAGFTLEARSDCSAAAAPTLDHLLAGVDRRWSTLLGMPGVSETALHALQASNRQYRAAYAEGRYRYLYLQFVSNPRSNSR